MQHNGIGFVSPCLFPCSLAQLNFRSVSLNQQANKVKGKEYVTLQDGLALFHQHEIQQIL
jgi:hypothetical protein